MLRGSPQSLNLGAVPPSPESGLRRAASEADPVDQHATIATIMTSPQCDALQPAIRSRRGRQNHCLVAAIRTAGKQQEAEEQREAEARHEAAPPAWVYRLTIGGRCPPVKPRSTGEDLHAEEQGRTYRGGDNHREDPDPDPGEHHQSVALDKAEAGDEQRDGRQVTR